MRLDILCVYGDMRLRWTYAFKYMRLRVYKGYIEYAFRYWVCVWTYALEICVVEMLCVRIIEYAFGLMRLRLNYLKA